MWKYDTAINWKEAKKGEMLAEGKPSLEVATPPEFGGPENIWTPEDLLTSAVASCLMTSLLFFAEKSRIVMCSYTSQATATMEKTPEGLRITGVKVAVHVTLAEKKQEAALKKAMAFAEKTCPVSHSLVCPVELTLQVSSEDA